MDKLKMQLTKIRDVVAREKTPEIEIGEILNTYRVHILNTLNVEDKELMTNLVKPLNLEGEFINQNLSLILCDQLLELL